MQIFTTAENRRLKRFSETAAAAVGRPPEPIPGIYLVDGAGGPELVEILAVADGLCLAADGRGFPQERADYVYVTVHLVQLGINKPTVS